MIPPSKRNPIIKGASPADKRPVAKTFEAIAFNSEATSVTDNPDGSSIPAAARVGQVLRGDRANLASPLELSPIAAPSIDFPILRQKGRDDDRETRETPARPDPAAIEADLKKDFEERVDRTRTDAYREGYEAARQELAESYEQRLTGFSDQIDHIGQAWTEFFSSAEPVMVELSMKIAETVLDSSLPDSLRDVCSRAISAAVERLSETEPVEITIHPVSYLQMQENGLIDQLSSIHPAIRWIVVPEIDVGDWIVQSPASLIRRIRKELLQELRMLLELPPQAEDNDND